MVHPVTMTSDPKPLRLLAVVPLLGVLALAAVALAPSASASCIPRPDDPAQNMLCVTPVGHPTGTCVSYFVNPPLPGTSTGGWVCQPIPVCDQTPVGCVIDVCVSRFCFSVILRGNVVDSLLGE